MNKGYTLLELVVAIVLMGIVLPIIMNPLLTLSVKGANVDNMRIAGNLAESKLEQIAGLPFSQVVEQATQNIAAPYTDYSQAIHVSYVGPASLNIVSATSTDFKSVKIAVAYKGYQPFVVTTLVTNL